MHIVLNLLVTHRMKEQAPPWKRPPAPLISVRKTYTGYTPPSNKTKYIGYTLKTYTGYTLPIYKHHTVKNWYIILCYACLLHRIYKFREFRICSQNTYRGYMPPSSKHQTVKKLVCLYISYTEDKGASTTLKSTLIKCQNHIHRLHALLQQH